MTTPAAPVYIVDDDASVRDAVGRLVRSAGWKTETFASAQEFLASPWADVPSCLILDVQLPGLSGLDLQQQLAKAARGPRSFFSPATVTFRRRSGQSRRAPWNS